MEKIKIFNKEDIIEILIREKVFLYKKYNISAIGIFGSYVRNEQKKNSDIDILIEFSKHPDFFTFIRIEEYLSKLLGKKVDLVVKDSLKPIIGKFVCKEVVYV